MNYKRKGPKQSRARCMLCKPTKNSHNRTAGRMKARREWRRLEGSSRTALADTRTPEQRTRIMASVRSKNTSPEVRLRRELFRAGVRGWRCHYKHAPGTPDVAWPSLRVALFVDGGFWHGHPSRHKPGRSGQLG